MKEKVNIAIIDSGINRGYFSDIDVCGTSFNIINNKIIQNDNYEDANGHGTSCAYTIYKYNKDINLIIIKILNNENYTHPVLLVNALEYANCIDLDIINLSISINNAKYFNDIKYQIDNLLKKNTILIVSENNTSECNLLTELNGTISVSGAILKYENDFLFNEKELHNSIASNIPIMAMANNEKYHMFMGTSKATATLTGVISNYIHMYPDIKYNLFKFLSQKACYNEWNNTYIGTLNNENYIYHTEKNINNCPNNELVSIIGHYLHISDTDVLKTKSLYNIGLHKNNCIDLLFYIENYFKTSFDYSLIDYFTFYNIYNLNNYLLYHI